MSYVDLFRDYLYSQQFSSPLKEPLEYILFNEGHWIRPQLVLAWCEYSGGNLEDALPLALAIEYIHTASLIHDDLPSMDNAVERRHKPCLHLVYGEATAILVGDALLNLAFSAISDSKLEAFYKTMILSILSEINNSLCQGQLMELTTLTDIMADKERYDALLQIHQYKTADLIQGACLLGAVISGNSDLQVKAKRYGNALGMLYQLLDDVADKDGISLIINEDEINNLKNMYKEKCTLPEKNDNNGYIFLTNLIMNLN